MHALSCTQLTIHYQRHTLIYKKSDQVVAAMQLQLPRIHNGLETFKKKSELVVYHLTGVTATLTQTWLLFAGCSAVGELRC